MLFYILCYANNAHLFSWLFLLVDLDTVFWLDEYLICTVMRNKLLSICLYIVLLESPMSSVLRHKIRLSKEGSRSFWICTGTYYNYHWKWLENYHWKWLENIAMSNLIQTQSTYRNYFGVEKIKNLHSVWFEIELLKNILVLKR